MKMFKKTFGFIIIVIKWYY